MVTNTEIEKILGPNLIFAPLSMPCLGLCTSAIGTYLDVVGTALFFHVPLEENRASLPASSTKPELGREKIKYLIP